MVGLGLWDANRGPVWQKRSRIEFWGPKSVRDREMVIFWFRIFIFVKPIRGYSEFKTSIFFCRVPVTVSDQVRGLIRGSEPIQLGFGWNFRIFVQSGTKNPWSYPCIGLPLILSLIFQSIQQGQILEGFDPQVPGLWLWDLRLRWFFVTKPYLLWLEMVGLGLWDANRGLVW